jgi:hypothetical protein
VGTIGVIANSKFVLVSTSARKLEGFGARAGAFSIERDTPPTEAALLWRLQLVGKNVLIGVSRVPKSACFVECLGSFPARWQVLGFLKSLYCLSITFWIREKGGRSFAHWGLHTTSRTPFYAARTKKFHGRPKLAFIGRASFPLPKGAQSTYASAPGPF